jgi:acyl carrier protein
MDAIGERVRQTIVNQLGLPASEVTDAARFVDLSATSVDIVEMIMALEDAFEVDISDAEAEEMRTVGDVVAFMKRAQG